MSTVVDKQNMMDSIIEYGTPQDHRASPYKTTENQKHTRTLSLNDQAREVKEKFNMFEQFFILSL